ncbi:MAG: DUF3054 domain-containing protein [Acidimicrobiia bacterium]
MRSRTRSDRAALAAVVDVVCVLAFVVAGRRSHDEDSGIGGVLEVAAPFLIALAVGWLVLRIWRRPTALSPAVGLWVVTVALGLVLRRFAFDRGTAASFVIVATLVLGLLLLGWRLVARRR